MDLTEDEEADALAHEFFADTRADTWFAKAMGMWDGLGTSPPFHLLYFCRPLQTVLAAAVLFTAANQRFAAAWASAAAGGFTVRVMKGLAM